MPELLPVHRTVARPAPISHAPGFHRYSRHGWRRRGQRGRRCAEPSPRISVQEPVGPDSATPRKKIARTEWTDGQPDPYMEALLEQSRAQTEDAPTDRRPAASVRGGAHRRPARADPAGRELNGARIAIDGALQSLQAMGDWNADSLESTGASLRKTAAAASEAGSAVEASRAAEAARLCRGGARGTRPKERTAGTVLPPEANQLLLGAPTCATESARTGRHRKLSHPASGDCSDDESRSPHTGSMTHGRSGNTARRSFAILVAIASLRTGARKPSPGRRSSGRGGPWRNNPRERSDSFPMTFRVAFLCFSLSLLIAPLELARQPAPPSPSQEAVAACAGRESGASCPLQYQAGLSPGAASGCPAGPSLAPLNRRRARGLPPRRSRPARVSTMVRRVASPDLEASRSPASAGAVRPVNRRPACPRARSRFPPPAAAVGDAPPPARYELSSRRHRLARRGQLQRLLAPGHPDRAPLVRWRRPGAAQRRDRARSSLPPHLPLLARLRSGDRSRTAVCLSSLRPLRT
jgi:hypothetical protein